MDDLTKGLRSGMMKTFVIEYCKCGNATEAARRAGYTWPNKQGPKLLQHEGVQAAIAQFYAEKAMDIDEVLGRLADIARATPESFLDIGPLGEPVFNFKKAQEAGQLHLVKKMWQDRDGNWRVELHSSLEALVHIGRHLGLFREAHDHRFPDGLPMFVMRLDIDQASEELKDWEAKRRGGATDTAGND